MKEALESYLKGGGSKGSELGTGAPPPTFKMDDDEEEGGMGKEGSDPLLASIQGKLATASPDQLAQIDKILSGGGAGGGGMPMPSGGMME